MAELWTYNMWHMFQFYQFLNAKLTFTVHHITCNQLRQLYNFESDVCNGDSSTPPCWERCQTNMNISWGNNHFISFQDSLIFKQTNKKSKDNFLRIYWRATSDFCRYVIKTLLSVFATVNKLAKLREGLKKRTVFVVASRVHFAKIHSG